MQVNNVSVTNGLLVTLIDLMRKSSSATTKAPTVDFAVDMFDRQDQDTLGPYWSNTEYAIRGGKVVRSVGDTPAANYFASVGGSYAHYSLGAHCFTDQPKNGSAVYSADLTSSDFTCEVVSSVPQYSNPPPPFSDVNSYYSHQSLYAEMHLYYQVAAGAGACVANAQLGVFGLSVMTVDCPAQLHTSLTLQASTPAIVLSRVSLGSQLVVAPVPGEGVLTSFVSNNYTSAIAVVQSGHRDLMAIGLNTITTSCVGDNVAMSVNGAVIYSGTPATVSAKGRTRAGIMTGPESAVNALDAAPNASLGGIVSFKVWRNDIPTPPDESGHGTYVNGRWQYTDKYHTANKDADGNIIRNADGTVASYTYNPEA